MIRPMKKLLLVGATLLSLGLTSMTFTSCGPDQTVQPQPNPDPIPNPQPNPDEKNTPEPFLQLDEAGKLKALPVPFADFTGGAKELQAWEAPYKSTLKSDKVEGDLKTFLYLPGAEEPNRDQFSMRRYEVEKKGNGTLKSAGVILKTSLLFEGDALLEHVQDLLEKDQYIALEQNIYQNSKYIVMFSKMDKDHSAIIYLRSTKAATEKFDAARKDFPLISIPFSELTAEKIKAHEAKVGRTLNTKSSTATKLVFVSLKENEHNLQIVQYILAAEGNTQPCITSSSVALSEDIFNNDAAVESYFTGNGFPKPTPKGDMLLSENGNYTLSISFIGGNSTLLFFPKNSGSQGTSDEALKPYTKFRESIEENGAVAQFEKARGSSVEFHAEKPDGEYGFEQATLVVAPAVGAKLPLPVIGWTYYGANPEYDEPESDVRKYYECDIDFTQRYGEGDVDFEPLAKMIKAWGFEMTQDKTHKASSYFASDSWVFQNKTMGIEIKVSNLFMVNDGKEEAVGKTTLMFYALSNSEAKRGLRLNAHMQKKLQYPK